MQSLCFRASRDRAIRPLLSSQSTMISFISRRTGPRSLESRRNPRGRRDLRHPGDRNHPLDRRNRRNRRNHYLNSQCIGLFRRNRCDRCLHCQENRILLDRRNRRNRRNQGNQGNHCLPHRKNRRKHRQQLRWWCLRWWTYRRIMITWCGKDKEHWPLALFFVQTLAKVQRLIRLRDRCLNNSPTYHKTSARITGQLHQSTRPYPFQTMRTYSKSDPVLKLRYYAYT